MKLWVYACFCSNESNSISSAISTFDWLYAWSFHCKLSFVYHISRQMYWSHDRFQFCMYFIQTIIWTMSIGNELFWWHFIKTLTLPYVSLQPWLQSLFLIVYRQHICRRADSIYVLIVYRLRICRRPDLIYVLIVYRLRICRRPDLIYVLIVYRLHICRRRDLIYVLIVYRLRICRRRDLIYVLIVYRLRICRRRDLICFDCL